MIFNKFLKLFYIVTSFNIIISAQPDSTLQKVDSLYNFIDINYNIILNADSALNNFFNKISLLSDKQTDKITIYHFGDSHVGALAFPNKMAELFHQKYDFAGRIIYEEPYQVKKTRKKLGIKRTEKGDSIKPNGVKYISYGNSGKTFNFFTQSEIIAQHIIKYEPDLIIITLGTNDAYGRNFNEDSVENDILFLIERIKKINPTTSILITTPPDSYIKRKKPNPKINIVRESITKLGIKQNYAVWDYYSVMGGNKSMTQWLKAQLASKDKIHLTKKGYHLKAELLFYGLHSQYQKYLQNKTIPLIEETNQEIKSE